MTVLQFYNTLSRFGMDTLMKERGSVLAAFSGGADSSCLLVLLRDWCREHGVELSAAHVNHLIRGEEADRDEAFCRERCRELGVPLSVLREDVPDETVTQPVILRPPVPAGDLPCHDSPVREIPLSSGRNPDPAAG